MLSLLRSAAGRFLGGVEQIHNTVRMGYWRLRLASLGEGSLIYSHARIYVPKTIAIGKRVSINDFVHLRGAGGIEIGDDTLIAPGVVITTQSHDVDALIKCQTYRATSTLAPVKIGQNVWIGAGAIILPGVTIGSNAVVAAGAVVRADVAQGTLVAGVPAKFIRSLREAG